MHLIVNKKCDTWRQVDAMLVTDDLTFQPLGREKPRFAYFDSYSIQPTDSASWRGSGKGLNPDAWRRSPLGGRDFSMWNVFGQKWPDDLLAKADALSLYDAYFALSPHEDIAKDFRQQFAGRSDVPIMSWPHLLPGFRLGFGPDLSDDAPLRRWLDHNGNAPFFILTNNSGPAFTGTSGPGTYQALSGPLKDRFLGYIHGESIGTEEVRQPKKPLGRTRRAHVDALSTYIKKKQAEEFGKFYKTPVTEEHVTKGISCLSTDSNAMAHLFHEMGCDTVGYEIDSSQLNSPLRVAFERGAARQYRGRWINYASGNFGDACNMFSKQHIPRGSEAWFHSKYAITDGVTACWYRKLYYLNYLGGASAIFWEQSLINQFFKPGPGDHPVQLTPFGRATVDFLSFVDRLPDRGEPYAPVAFLLSYGNGHERMQYTGKLLGHFAEDENDRELRELFNAAWYPAGVIEGLAAAPDVQNLPSGVYGNIYDVLVDRGARLDALMSYPIVIAAGDVELGGANLAKLREYVEKGGTLVVNVEAAKGKLPAEMLGVTLKNDRTKYEQWQPVGGEARACSPYQVERAELAGAAPLVLAAPDVPLVTRHRVGEGAVILTLVPHLLGYDERAHAALPYLLNGLTRDLLPVEVVATDGQPLDGQIMYQLNRTKDGWLIALFNNRGVDKTQSGVARVDRRQFVDVALRTKLRVKSAKEFTQPRDLPMTRGTYQVTIPVRIHPGDVQVVGLAL